MGTRSHGRAPRERGARAGREAGWRGRGSGSARGLSEGIAFGVAVAAVLAVLYGSLLRGSPWLAPASELVKGKLEQLHVATPLGFVGLALFYSLAHSFL